MDDLASAPTALDLYRAPRNHFLSFGCATLDAALRGVPRNSITELCGVAGSGKTQLALQLLLRAQLPESVGGLGGKAFFLSCGEGPFPSQRLRQLAQALVARADVPYSEQQLLERVYVETVDTFERMRVVLRDALPELLRQGDVRLVVIDSVAALTRGDGVDGEFSGDHGARGAGASAGAGSRARADALFALAAELKRAARAHDTTFVVTNHVTADFASAADDAVKPALGLAWSHCVDARFMLRRLPSAAEIAEAEAAERARLAAAAGAPPPPPPPGAAGAPVSCAPPAVAADTPGSRREIEVVLSACAPHVTCEYHITADGVVGAVGSCRSRESGLRPMDYADRSPAAAAAGGGPRACEVK